MKQIVTNIGLLAGVGHEGKRCLKGKEMAQLNTIANAYLVMEGGRIADYGAMAACPGLAGVEVIDAKGGAVLP